MQKAESVVAALEESAPQVLVELAQKGELVAYIRQRVDSYNLEYVRRMRGQPANREGEVVESLMPLLIEVQPSPDQRPLSQAQKQQVQRQVLRYLVSLHRPASVANPPTPGKTSA
jgi:hypothetical protein